MGLAASQARLLMLTSRKSDIEMQQMQINQAKMTMSNTVGEMFTLTQSLDPGSPEIEQLQQRQQALQLVEKAMDLQLERLNTQYQAITAELEGVRKVISSNIKATFKALG